jgi:hypothetical protein
MAEEEVVVGGFLVTNFIGLHPVGFSQEEEDIGLNLLSHYGFPVP